MFSFFKKSAPQETEQIEVRDDFQDPLPIAEYCKKRTGISFDQQTVILKSKLISFCRSKGIHNFDSCLEELKKKTDLEQALFNYLATNETYFYREFSQIKELVSLVKSDAESVNILCMPCSTGEEPYSIVIALLDAGVSQDKFNVLGVDISTEVIEKAQQAVYNQRNISRMPSGLVSQYFLLQDGKYYLNAQVKSAVKFKSFNLFDSKISNIGKFNYVLSRNMLIYFDMETKRKASLILEGLLKNPRQAIFYGHADLY